MMQPMRGFIFKKDAKGEGRGTGGEGVTKKDANGKKRGKWSHRHVHSSPNSSATNKREQNKENKRTFGHPADSPWAPIHKLAFEECSIFQVFALQSFELELERTIHNKMCLIMVVVVEFFEKNCHITRLMPFARRFSWTSWGSHKL
jgi:hypothetical protein